MTDGTEEYVPLGVFVITEVQSIRYKRWYFYDYTR
jgi:hypothetical protein